MSSLTTAMWVHGLIAQAEYPVHSEVVKGWGKEFAGHWISNWFHIPITTPAMLEGVRPKLANVSVFYKTDGAVVSALHVYDGPNKVREFDVVPPLEGDHSASIDSSNTWEIDPPIEMKLGLGISILVTNKYYKESEAQEVQGGDETNPYEESAAKKVSITKFPISVLFTAAGADFQVPGPSEAKSGPGTNTLLPNQNLVRGQSLFSNNGLYRLDFNSDGNLILYNISDPQNHLFDAHTYAPAGIIADAKCIMQGDGNLVVWRQGMGAIWDSETWDHPGAYLRVEDDGKIYIVDPVNRIWHKPD